MKLLIAGSRSVDNIELFEYIPEGVTLIISGGANGVDSLAEKYADSKRISKLILRPDYQKYGKSAPLKRNTVMVDLADTVLVVWDGKSKGTKYTIDYAKKKGKNMVLVMYRSKELSVVE